MAVNRTRSLPALLLLVAFAAPGSAADKAETSTKKLDWEVARTSSPDTVEELKALQTKVKTVVDKVTPATVGILIGAGAGSGVIVKDDGLVLTAAHVIGSEPGKSLVVVLPDGKIVKGKSLGVNPKFDSGMLQITDKPPADATWPGAKQGKWPVAELGTANDLKRGQWVISLGHPGGPKKDRRPPVRVGRFENYTLKDQTLRSDCTLVGGDSGGPLFDLDGKVIGIHSRIGLFLENNMHVSAEAFRDEWDQLAKGSVIGRASDVELGVVLDESAETATVSSVVDGSPAAKAGLKAGDIIVKFGGERVHTGDDVAQMLTGCKPGQEVTLEIQRGEDLKKLTVTLAKRKSSRDREREKPKDDE